MEYQEIYIYFYSKYYTKTEFLIKRFLLKSQTQNKIFNIAYNEIQHYLHNDFSIKNNLNQNENLKKIHKIFRNRHRIYNFKPEQHIFEKEILIAFNQIDYSDLPKKYLFKKLIIEIAIFEAVNEVARLFSNQSHLLAMFYKLNEFENFEIRTHENLAIEDFPIYKQLSLKLYPNQDSDNLILNENEELIFNSNSKIEYNRNHWNKNCFDLFHYLVGNYEKKGKIKFINIFYFLKRNVNKNTYSFMFTMAEYKDFVQTNFGVTLTKFTTAEYEFEDKVIPILNGFEQDFLAIK